MDTSSDLNENLPTSSSHPGLDSMACSGRSLLKEKSCGFVHVEKIGEMIEI